MRILGRPPSLLFPSSSTPIFRIHTFPQMRAAPGRIPYAISYIFEVKCDRIPEAYPSAIHTAMASSSFHKGTLTIQCTLRSNAETSFMTVIITNPHIKGSMIHTLHTCQKNS